MESAARCIQMETMQCNTARPARSPFFSVNRIRALHSFLFVDCIRAKREIIISAITSSFFIIFTLRNQIVSRSQFASRAVVFLASFFIETIYQTKDSSERFSSEQTNERSNRTKQKNE